MAESGSEEPEVGAPVAKDAIDPDLVKLQRARPKIGVITAAGVVFLAVLSLLKLNPDRRFGASDAEPARVTVSDVLADNVGLDRYVTIQAEPMVSHAIRVTLAKGNTGYRVAPVRASDDKLWIVLPGDGWQAPSNFSYTGRLRKLSDLPIHHAVSDYADDHPRPMFATAKALRAGFAGGSVATVGGGTIKPADGDQVAFDIIDPNASLVVASYVERLPDATAWAKALDAAQIAPTSTKPGTEQVRFEVAAPAAEVAAKLEHAGLVAAHAEAMPKHYTTTWATLRTSSPSGLIVASATGTATIPDEQVDLVGLYVGRGVPSDAYALITDERPTDYWYVLPIAVAVAVIGLIFAWALVRAVRRDLLPARAA
jgi:hypothetical protein